MNTINAAAPDDCHPDDPLDEEAARDARRMADIDRYGLPGLLESAPRRDLHGLARLAARLFGAPMAMITFIDETHLRTIATVGFDDGDLPRAASLCNAVLYDAEPLLCEDLAADPRYADSTPVTAGFARFYASQQLIAPSGEPIGSLCVFDPEPRAIDPAQAESLHDLAERVVDALELELRSRELAGAVGELRRSNEALAAFAEQVSHDLRNPLAVLSGNLEVVEDLLSVEEPDLDRVRPLLRRTQRSAGRMAELIGEVLDLAEVGGEPRVEDVDVDALAAEVLDDLSTELSDADLDVARLGHVCADRVQLRVVLQNLLSNAAKHARPGHRASVSVSASTGDGWWRLVVADRGRGIDPRDRERIFEPFTRLDRRVPGTGVGLATCRRVAVVHGGRIGVGDTDGGGATVWFEIPATGVVHSA